MAAALVALLVSLGSARARAEVKVPEPSPNDPIQIAADGGRRWREGVYEVWLLEGHCLLRQGLTYAHCDRAMLWIDRSSTPEEPHHKVIAYLEGNVDIQFVSGGASAKLADQSWFGRFYTDREITVRVPPPGPGGEPAEKPPIYRRAMLEREPGRDGAIRRTQFEEITGGANAPPAGTRRLRVFRRSNVPVQVKLDTNPNTGEITVIVSPGVNLIIDGVEGAGSVDIATDRMVIWTRDLQGVAVGGEALQSSDQPLEIYMEGNIEFRQGDRVVYADRMYYDARQEVGIVLNAELLTPAPGYQGLLRLKAGAVRQLGRDRFFAQDAFITSSRMGNPRYRVQTGSLLIDDRQQILPVAGGGPAAPGVTAVDHQQRATAEDITIYAGEVPIFYWPSFSTRLDNPTIFLNRVTVEQDSIFGTQVAAELNAFELFGLEHPPGTDWDITLGVLSERGFGHGTRYDYSGDGLLGVPGPYQGFIDYWGINEQDLDNLGRGRRAVLPGKDYRWRMLGRHRQILPYDWQLSGELGWISDYNFLEQYFENEWDTFKDQSTKIELKRLMENTSWNITGAVRLNEFFAETEWLPRVDHFWLGESLLGDRLTWYEHSQAGYGHLKPAAPPPDPTEAATFGNLAWEADRQGERLVTRQELDLPFSAGPVKVVPFALGELAHWGEALDGDDLQRVYGQLGVRASMPVWRVFPTVESRLFNLHGMAHKAIFDMEFTYSDANRDLTELPLYDNLDDNAIEHFRRRFAVNTFGVMPDALPARFDERIYALRSGLGSWVSSPSTEIADDLTAMRMGVRQRWQTKRGFPGEQRIIDWVTLDTNATWFPEDDEDNFGEPLGLVDYDLRWHVGDRTTVVSTGIFDFFDEGQQLVSVGGFLNRPPKGSAYLGYTYLGGPIEGQILSLSFDYRLGPKWLARLGTSFDFANDGNIGQRVAITRIGESFLVSLGLNVDSSKDNVGVLLTVEPRFLPSVFGRGRVAGAQIAPAGAFGLE